MRKALSFTFLFIFAICTSSCGSSEPASTTTPPPPTQLPPSEEPTLEPTATKTPIPYGALYACIYDEGVLVGGFIRIRNEMGNVVGDRDIRNDGCETRLLSPGYYTVYASGGTTTTGHCDGNEYTIEMLPDGYIELEFELVCPGTTE